MMARAMHTRLWCVSVALMCGTALLVTSPASAEPLGAASTPLESPAHEWFHLDRTDAYLLAAGAAATVLALHAEDQPRARRGLDAVVSGAGDLGNPYGSWGVWAVTGVLAGAGRMTSHEAIESAGWESATSLLLTTMVVSGLKVALDRERPDGGRYSFPSGHTSSAFCVAPVIARHFGWKAGALAYTAALATGLGRIEDNRHFPSDVVAGATLGVVIGGAVAGPPDRRALSLFATGHRFGLRLSF